MKTQHIYMTFTREGQPLSIVLCTVENSFKINDFHCNFLGYLSHLLLNFHKLCSFRFNFKGVFQVENFTCHKKFHFSN